MVASVQKRLKKKNVRKKLIRHSAVFIKLKKLLKKNYRKISKKLLTGTSYNCCSFEIWQFGIKQKVVRNFCNTFSVCLVDFLTILQHDYQWLGVDDSFGFFCQYRVQIENSLVLFPIFDCLIMQHFFLIYIYIYIYITIN